METSEQGLYHHFMPMLQPNWMKIITLNANTKEIATSDSCYGQSDKNCHFKCKYLGNITPRWPLSIVTKIHMWMAKISQQSMQI